jgi:hypothetical protein
MNFDPNSIRVIEFGIGRDEGKGQSFYDLPVDNQVQKILRQMLLDTIKAMNDISTEPSLYTPSEKHGGSEHLYLPLDDALSSFANEIFNAKNLKVNAKGLSNTADIFCYFARFYDKNDQKLTAVHRATQFKGVLRSRLLQFTSDALTIVKDKVFKLDADFDFLIDNKNVHVLHPSGYEFTSKLQLALMSAVPEHIKEMEKDLRFIDFTNISKYSSEHPRAARYLSSIRSLGETTNLNMKHLVRQCENTGVEIKVEGEKIYVEEANIMAFLEVLDRRRFQIELVAGTPESYKAASREKLNSKAK